MPKRTPKNLSNCVQPNFQCNADVKLENNNNVANKTKNTRTTWEGSLINDVAQIWVFSSPSLSCTYDFCTVRIWIPNLFGILMVEKRLDAKCLVFEYQAQPFEYQTNGRHMFLCTGFVFKWLVKYIAQRPNHLKSKLQNVQYSNVSGIQMVGIQIPTVLLSQ